jgi:hypothetical protein
MKRVFEIEWEPKTQRDGTLARQLRVALENTFYHGAVVTELDLDAIKRQARLGALESVHDVIRNTDTTATYEAYKQIVYFVQDSIDLVTREIAAAEEKEGKP